MAGETGGTGQEGGRHGVGRSTCTELSMRLEEVLFVED